MANLPALILSAALWCGVPAGTDSGLTYLGSVGSFSGASRLLVTAQQWVAVLDAERNLLFCYPDQAGAPLTVGGSGWSATSFDTPTAIASDGLNFFVADYGNHRVLQFDRTLSHLSTFSTRDTSYAPARFGYPAGLALSRSGAMVILDTENSRVVQFNADRRFEREFGGINDLRGKLTQPVKVLFDHADRILVLERNRLLLFDAWGNFIKTFDHPLLRDAVGFDITPDQIIIALKKQILFFDERGAVVRTISVSDLPELLSSESLRDCVMAGKTLFLLTPERVLKYNFPE